MVASTKTWLDDSVKVSNIPEYNLVSLRDCVKARKIEFNDEGTPTLEYKYSADHFEKGPAIVPNQTHL